MRKKILFAEDHPLFRETIINSLNDVTKFSIDTVSNGLELLNHLENSMPDLLLLDLEMPKMDGNTAFTRVKQRYPLLKVIIFSSYDSPALVKNYRDRGANGYISKGKIQDIDNLVEAIKTVLNGDSFFYSTDSSIRYTKRELEIIPRMVEGKTTKQIGKELRIGGKAVEKHRNNLYKKLGAKSLAELLRLLIKDGAEFLGR
ncbi:MAG: response regulator transcription factor [Bacteroidetes bacterium]|jgi:two-component system NarL family response regulator|nr:response regulator transcription factor [Bacteroidota bacterium]